MVRMFRITRNQVPNQDEVAISLDALYLGFLSLVRDKNVKTFCMFIRGLAAIYAQSVLTELNPKWVLSGL